MTTDDKRVEALVFDAYGTLFDPRSVSTAIDRKFPGLGPAISGKWRAKQLEYTWLRTSMGRYEDFWKVTESALVFACNDLKVPCDAATRAQWMEGYLHLDLFPEVRRSLESLSRRPLAILSNGTSQMLQAVVETAGLEATFARVLSVDEVKTYKPNPAVYELAVRKLGVDRKNIGFVSSNFWDAAGAKAFGLRTYWLDRTGSPADELGVAPDVSLTSLAELAELVNP